MIYREGDDRYELLQEDDFLGNERQDGDNDLSDDPMLAPDDRRKIPKESRKQKKARLEQERLAAEREALKEELRKELKAELQNGDGKGTGGGNGEEKEGRTSKFGRSIMSVLSGNILSRSEARRTYPYLIFIAFLALLYIANIFSMQRLHTRHDKLNLEVKELRAKSLMVAADKMEITRQSNIMKEVEKRKLPLKESLEPNKVIRK